MAVTVEVLVAATAVVGMRKELVTKPRCESLPAALHSPSQLVPASYRSHSCWPVAEHFDTYFTPAILLVQGHRVRKSQKPNLPQPSGPSAHQLLALAE